jgi:5-methyltetrahydropteroyltriglutamate--homocysteine methyltransferase
MLDHEFASIPQNIIMYTRNDLESAQKIIGYGCVETNMEPALLIEIQKDGDWSKVVEPVDVIKKRILEAIHQWGRENIILDPDCGFGGLRGYIRGNLTEDSLLKICSNKLANMVQAKKEIV